MIKKEAGTVHKMKVRNRFLNLRDELMMSNNQITCFDCHMTDTQGAGIVNTHGSANNDMLVSAVDSTTHFAGIEAFCTRCHKSSSYVGSSTGSRFSDHSKGQHSGNTYSCRGCHAGQVDSDTSDGIDNGSIYPQLMVHGTDWTWPGNALTPNIDQDAFLFGGWLGGNDVSALTCYGSNCSHGGTPKSW